MTLQDFGPNSRRPERTFCGSPPIRFAAQDKFKKQHDLTVWPKGSVPGHAEEVLAAARALSG